MGRLSKIRDAIAGVAPYWSNVRTALRGMPIYCDPILTGTSRFSRKTGTIGLVNPDVEIALSAAVPVNSDYIDVDRLNQWFGIDAVITIGTIERFAITNVNAKRISLNQPTKVKQPARTSISLYAVPIKSLTDYEKGAKTLQFRSKHPVMIGDKIAFEIQTNIFVEIAALKVKDLGTTSNEFKFTYEVTLESGIPYDLEVDQKIHMRAFPAYFSKVIKIPKNPLSARPIGPFLIDYFGGRINDGVSPEVFCTLQLYDVFSNKIGSVDPVLVPVNFPLTARSISSDTIMFWDLMKGSFRLKSMNAVAVCDAEGSFGASYNLQPQFSPGNKWRISVTSNKDAVLRFGFEPNPFKSYHLSAEIPASIVVGTESGSSMISRITVAATSQAGAEIEFGEWTLQEPEAERFAYNIMARVDREAVWLGSGAIVKPYFLTLDYLTASYDNEQTHDSGLIYL